MHNRHLTPLSLPDCTIAIGRAGFGHLPCPMERRDILNRFFGRKSCITPLHMGRIWKETFGFIKNERNFDMALRPVRWLVYLLFFLACQNMQAESVYQEGSEKFKAGQYDSALYYFNQLVADSGVTKEALYNRGLAYYRLQKYTEAIQDFKGSMVLDTNFKEAEWMLALSLQEKGRWKEALTIYQMLNTKYSGYNGAKKRILYLRLSVFICDNWYYMVAIMFLVIIFVTVVAKTITYKKG